MTHVEEIVCVYVCVCVCTCGRRVSVARSRSFDGLLALN